MTYHINNFKTKNKLWCDGAKIEKVKKTKNKYLLKGALYLLPEDEEAPNVFKNMESSGPYLFEGYVKLAENKDKVLDYRFVIQLIGVQLYCTRKI